MSWKTPEYCKGCFFNGSDICELPSTGERIGFMARTALGSLAADAAYTAIAFNGILPAPSSNGHDKGPLGEAQDTRNPMEIRVAKCIAFHKSLDIDRPEQL